MKTAEDNYAKHHQKNLKARLVKQHIEELNIFHTSKIKVPTSILDATLGVFTPII